MSEWRFDTEPTEDDLKFLDNQLEQFNKDAAGKYDFKPLHLIYRDQDDQIAAGLKSVTGWGWLYISTLWVAADSRRKGIGTKLLQQAEREARERGCDYACLTTFSFQAPRFYERRGYVAFGILDDYPDGQQMIFLKKRLPRERS